MELDKLKIIDRLLYFDLFKRQLQRYSVMHKKNLTEHGGANSSFFTAMETEEKALHWHSVQVLNEVEENIKSLNRDDLVVVLKEMQVFLDTFYKQIDLEYSTAPTTSDWHPCLPSIVPKLQNKIKAEWERISFEENKQVLEPVPVDKKNTLSVKQIIIAHHFWGKIDSTKNLTSTNLEKYSKIHNNVAVTSLKKALANYNKNNIAYISSVGFSIAQKSWWQKDFNSVIEYLSKECPGAKIACDKYFTENNN